ncbi:MAG: hypothetical protein U5K76_07220 [Woeseiaceae bacterium]|nr:hypothetical protein [Woeseiaceae bacterium]
MTTRLVKIVALLALASASLDAAADFRTVARAHEVALSQLRLPATVNGTLAFRSCDSCDPQTMSVTAATEYRINDQPVQMREFRRQMLQVRNRAERIVIVRQDLASGAVESVSVRLADRDD